jgi:hypothetical protein
MFLPQMVVQKLFNRRDLGRGDGAIERIEVTARFKRIEQFWLKLDSARHHSQPAPRPRSPFREAVLILPSRARVSADLSHQ